MKMSFVSLVSALIMSLVLSGCAAQEPAGLATPAKIDAGTQGMPAWQEEWEQLVKEAKKEGSIAIYAAFVPPIRIAIADAFKQKYGIDMDVTMGREVEIVEKIKRENRAGLNMADVVISGRTIGLALSEPAGLLSTLEPVLLLPEVKDPQVWWQGKLPYIEDTTTLAFIAYVQAAVTINTDMVKTAEMSSMRDILNPRWKGKIAMNDPRVGGTGLSWFSAFSELLDYDFMRDLAKMEPVFTADRRLLVEWIAKGKHPLGLATTDAEVANFISLGAPLSPIIPKEGSYLTHGAGVVSVVTKAPHRNAAKLFINWLLSREGQTIYVKAAGYQSARVDVPTDHLLPFKMRQPGVKYLLEDLSLRPEKEKMVREIFGHLLK